MTETEPAASATPVAVPQPATPATMPDGTTRPLVAQPQSPSIGRMVLFTPADPNETINGATEFIAIIGQVFTEPPNSAVPIPVAYSNLYVLAPFAEAYWVGSVQQADPANPARQGYTWRWPPRV